MDTTLATVMTAEQLLSIEQAHVGNYLGHGWTQDYFEMDGDEPAYYKVATPDGTVVATMPDWAGGVALFLAEAHDAVPQLIAEIRRLNATLAAVAAKAEEFPLLDDESTVRDYDLGRHDLAEAMRHLISQHRARRAAVTN